MSGYPDPDRAAFHLFGDDRTESIQSRIDECEGEAEILFRQSEAQFDAGNELESERLEMRAFAYRVESNRLKDELASCRF